MTGIRFTNNGDLTAAIQQFRNAARRRARNPVREARRQHEITRMRNRVIDFVPTYRDVFDRQGNLIASHYTGHVAVTAR
jgi:hypothetical protein